jgi:hypothetical protein
MSRSRFDDIDLIVPQHEQRITSFLYDEGPHTLPDIAVHLGLSDRRTQDILMLMRETGTLVVMEIGNPPKPHWLLAEDA